MLSISEKYLAVARHKGISIEKVAEKLGFSVQNAYKKLKRGNWSDEDLRKYADALGCDYEVTFIDRETGERF